MTAPLTPLTLEGFRAALASPDRNALLAAMADELRAMGDGLWTVVHDLANGEFADDEREAIADIEADFAEAEAREQFDEAAWSYETRTGKEWDSSPVLWYSGAWIARRAAELRGVAA